jgi:hypothetical protein
MGVVRWIVVCAGTLLSGGALADSEIYCEVSSLGFAWGLQYSGTVIAPNGTVALFEYDGREKSDGNLRENWQAPTRQELTKTFRPGRRVVASVCPDRRAWLRDQLEVVRAAGQSKTVDMQSRDFPTAQTHCFLFEEAQERGSPVLLQHFGDTETHNLSPAAPRLANWLNAVSAEARRRAQASAQEASCIGDLPSPTTPVYPDTFVELRQRVMGELKGTQHLHCEFAEGSSTEVDGEQRGNHAWPAKLSVVFTNLDSSAGRGRGEMFGDAYSVRIETSAAGLVLTNADAEERNASDVITILPIRIDGRALYPAVKHEIHVNNYGSRAIRYTGQCAPLPKSP